MNNEKPEESSPGNIPEPHTGHRQKRRTFVTRTGMIVPAILVAKSRSSLAAQCLSPSASASINLLHSREDRATSLCSGRSPGYWKNQSAGTYGFLNTPFNSAFSPGLTGEVTIQITGTNKKDGDKDSTALRGEQLTMQHVMQLDNVGDRNQFAAHIAAAWCNLSAGLVPSTVLNQQDLQDMWSDITRTGSYSPTQNVTWFVEDVKQYLLTTFH